MQAPAGPDGQTRQGEITVAGPNRAAQRWLQGARNWLASHLYPPDRGDRHRRAPPHAVPAEAPQDAATDAAQAPFFIVGCVRSGTTMLRDLLRRHPRLECPEETHFFRWAAPFGVRQYDNHYRSKQLARHREIDGITEEEFEAIFDAARSRRDLAERYAQAFMEKQGNPQGRWFDKTPQNVYGLPLLASAFPDAQFVHIFRNPLNVAASLQEGKVMPVQSLKAAINYWRETMLIVDAVNDCWPGRFYEVSYEDFVSDPGGHVADILRFVGEDRDIDISGFSTYLQSEKYRKMLNDEQIRAVVAETEPYFSRYGYLNPLAGRT